MKKFFLLIFICCMVTIPLTTLDLPANDDDILFQVSTLGAVQEGVYDGVAALKEMKLHGDFGIGTYDGLDGEMTYINGIFYQIKADGKVYTVDDAVKTPYAVVTKFTTDKKLNIGEPMDYKQLQDLILSQLPTKNIIYAVKVTGEFQYVKTRSVPKQSKPYPRLVEVTKNQPTFEMKNVKGTIMGFWLPDYSYGIKLILPTQSDFFKTTFSKDNLKELEKIEK